MPLPAEAPSADFGFALVFFVYGLALFSLALAVALEARHSSATEFAASLRYLAAFGFLQGGVEWLDASFVLDNAGVLPDEIRPGRVLAVLLLAGAATCLLLFACRLLAGLQPRHRWLLPVPWVLCAAWLVSLVVPHVSPMADVGYHGGGALCLECHRGLSSAFVAASGNWVTSAEVWARYLLYFPGSSLAAVALLAQRPRFSDLGLSRIARYCTGAAVAFAVDAVVGGLVVPPAPYLPASFLNYATYLQVLGHPPQLLSAAAAVAIALCVVQILSVFEIEHARQLARANEERFAAQQELLETQRRAQAEIAEWNRQLEAKVQERTVQLEALHAQLKDLAILEERDRIARELHDSLAQALGYVSLRASILESHLAANQLDAATSELEHIQRVADDAYADVREAILGLRTRTTKHDLLPTLEEYLRKFSLQTDVRADLEVGPETVVRFEPTVEIQLIRVIQEALTNVRKHAGAEHVRVRFWRENGRILAAVEDDGCGFDLAAVPHSGRFGLTTMRERVQVVGGRFSVQSKPGQGTRIVVDLPEAVARVEESAGGKA